MKLVVLLDSSALNKYISFANPYKSSRQISLSTYCIGLSRENFSIITKKIKISTNRKLKEEHSVYLVAIFQHGQNATAP